jgi:hypothetical protein
MTDREMLRRALDEGDATAFLGVADELAERGHPDAEELCGLAVEIATASDWSVVMMAGLVFLTILERTE